MILIMKSNAKEKQIQKLIDHIEREGIKLHINNEKDGTIIRLIGDTSNIEPDTFKSFVGVEKIVLISKSYKLTSREFHPEDTLVDVNGVKIGNGSMTIMAGPCSIESLDQIRQSAEIAKKGGASILRGGAFKPRTSPYSFQGLEEEGLKYIRQAADEYDMQVITEVMDEEHIPMVTQYSDILQVGSRNMQNFKLLEALGKTKKPIGLKRGMAATIDEWLNAAEYIAKEGNFNIIFIERGIRTYERATRNTLDLSAVPLIKSLSHFPIIVDPSHAVGVWDLVTPMARAAIGAGADGLMVEIHPDPENAWSDGGQSLNEDTYLAMMEEIKIMKKAMDEINRLV